MEWEAFNAGNDILCFAENVAEGIQYILKNATAERIEASYSRIMQCKEKVGLFNSTNPVTPIRHNTIDFTNSTNLNRKIAENCLTKVKSDNIPFRIQEAKQNKTLAQLSIYNDGFATKTMRSLDAPLFSIVAESSIDCKESISQYDTLLISLFVPKAKPLNQFDIEPKVLEYLGELLSTKNCVLYVFGNPYALQVIPQLALAKEIVLAYQDFEVFQDVAAQHLNTILVCKGELPVYIKNL